jgi:hypothetical protein
MSRQLHLVGRLVTDRDSTEHDVLLEEGQPLSRARVGTARMSLPRSLAESRAASLRRRIPVAVDDVGSALRRLFTANVSPVVLVLDDRLALLDLDQAEALMPEGTGLVELDAPVDVAHLRIEPVWAMGDGGKPPKGSMQYWNSQWTFVDEAWGAAVGAWRVLPQDVRFGGRGDFVAALSAAGHSDLGSPRYVVVENHFLPERFLAAAARLDLNLTEPRVIALDSSCREALGLSDGEFCHVYAWRRGYRARDWLRRIGARSVIAQVEIASRADMEKTLCRLSAEALDAVGAASGQAVVVESVREVDKTRGVWSVRSKRLRALAIDDAERAERLRWMQREGRSGYLDCAERLAIHPPYPPIYLDYFTRRDLGFDPDLLCAPVRVRASIADRLAGEASDFMWLAVGGLIVAILAAADAPAAVAIGVALAAVVLLAVVRILRALR